MAKRTTAKVKPVEDEGERHAPPVRVPPTISLDAIIGQERAVEILRGAMGAGRIHHAWIFVGPVGVGKFTAALAFGAELLMPRDKGGGAAGERVRELLAGGSHPDLHVITKELAAVSRDDGVRRQKQLNIALEVVREFLLEPASRTRMVTADSPAAKVFIVDEAEMLDWHGQDAMLKTLEEPPPGTVIILVASSEHELSPTIRSRSQRVAFTPLSEAAFAQWMKRSGLLEGAELSRDDLAFLERFAAGSPGVAAAAVRTGLVGWWRTIGPALMELDAGKFPFSFGQVLASLADEWAKARVSENERASKEAAKRAGARWILRIVGDHYRTRLREAVSKGLDAGGALAAVELIDRAEFQAERSVQLPFVMENLGAQLASVGAR